MSVLLTTILVILFPFWVLVFLWLIVTAFYHPHCYCVDHILPFQLEQEYKGSMRLIRMNTKGERMCPWMLKLIKRRPAAFSILNAQLVPNIKYFSFGSEVCGCLHWKHYDPSTNSYPLLYSTKKLSVYLFRLSCTQIWSSLILLPCWHLNKIPLPAWFKELSRCFHEAKMKTGIFRSMALQRQ